MNFFIKGSGKSRGGGPPYLGVWMTPPPPRPLIWRSGSATEMNKIFIESRWPSDRITKKRKTLINTISWRWRSLRSATFWCVPEFVAVPLLTVVGLMVLPATYLHNERYLNKHKFVIILFRTGCLIYMINVLLKWVSLINSHSVSH